MLHFTDDAVGPSDGSGEAVEHRSVADSNADHYNDVNQRPYLCMMCPKRFTTPRYLRTHITRHPTHYSDDLLKPYRSTAVY